MRLTIQGYKSIRNLENFELRPLNVLIGANGAGKSNFIGFFRFMKNLIDQRLQISVAVDGGAGADLFMGSSVTRRLAARFECDDNPYEFSLRPTAGDRFVFESERVGPVDLGSAHVESQAKDCADPVVRAVFDCISKWSTYHFHDTSLFASVRKPQASNDNELLRESADNLAPMLYRIQQTDRRAYERIRDIVRMAAPYFDDFILRPNPANEMIAVEWRQKNSDYPFKVYQLSDGLLRFICLVTALSQPVLPGVMLFDEPELGLHPHAMTLLGALLDQASLKSRIVISTQSPVLLNEFNAEDVIAVERSQGESTLRRLDVASVSRWLEDQSLGELWQRNILGARPRQEQFPEPVGHR